jgi:hypothetical protein
MPDIAAAEDDQVRRHVIQFERLDMSQRLRVFQARDRGYSGLCSEIEKDPIARQDARATVSAHLERLWRYETSMPDNQFCAGRGEVLHMQLDLMAYHVTLMAQHSRHIDCDAARDDAERLTMAGEMRHPGAP